MKGNGRKRFVEAQCDIILNDASEYQITKDIAEGAL